MAILELVKEKKKTTNNQKLNKKPSVEICEHKDEKGPHTGEQYFN